MAARSYRQACAIAGALDLLGERWTLLIVRDLLIGPQRYSDLLAGLPGIGTNLLAERLRSLTGAGIVERATLPAPVASRVYRLTAMGLELERPLLELCRWGLRHGIAPAGESSHDARWTVLAMRAAFDPERAVGIRVACDFRVGDLDFYARVEDGELHTGLGRSEAPDAVVSLDEEAFRRLASGRVELERLVDDGRATLEGDIESYRWLAGVFVL